MRIHGSLAASLALLLQLPLVHPALGKSAPAKLPTTTPAPITKSNSAVAGLLRNEMLNLYIDGQQVGRLTSRDQRNAEGHIELLRESDMTLRRGSMELRIRSQSVTVLSAEGAPLRFSSRREDATGIMRITGEVRSHGAERIVQVNTEAGGAKISHDIALPEGATLGAALEWQSRRQLKDGASFSGQVLLEELGALVKAKYQVQRNDQGFVIDSSTAGINQREQLDPQGMTLRVEIPSLGAYAVPSGTSPPPISASIDVLARTVWDAPADMPARARLQSALFRIDGALPNPLPQGRFQSQVEDAKGRIIVQVRRQGKGPIAKLSATERARFLAPTPYEAVKDPRIVEAARAAVQGARKPAQIVARLTRFVFDHIDAKDLSRAYAPATVTLESRTGDCTEHSVLFSALAKASGVPTKLIDGVVVADGKIGYHEWVEVYLPGEGWRPVDPTFGEAKAGPNRLKLAEGTSQPEDLMQMGLSAASALTGLKISVIGHTP